MKIKIWNAFASNNSGSYTIVGSFAKNEIAEEVAAELLLMAQAHSKWLEAAEAQGDFSNSSESPIERFSKKHGLENFGEAINDDFWPQYSDDITPKIFAIENKVVIHHEYTVSMPRLFGHYFYKRGGRVDNEIDHAHHPIVALFELHVPWQEKQKENVNVKERAQRIIEALNAVDGPFAKFSSNAHYSPGWRSGEGFGEADLTVGAIFDDLVNGFAAVKNIASSNGMKTHLKVFEAFNDADPLSFLRPPSPALSRGLRRVRLDGAGPTPKDVVKVIESLKRTTYENARKMLDAAPLELFYDLTPESAELIAEELRKARASVSVTER